MNILLDSISKTFRSLRQDGILLTGLRILHRLRIVSVLHSFNFTFKELVVRDGVLILNSLDEAAGAKICQMNGFRITLREIKEAELEKLSFAEGMFPFETMREHFARGMRFFAAFHDGVVVSVNGIHTRYAHLSYIKLPVVRLPQGTTYLNCALTSPRYRDLGFGTLVRTFLINQVWKEGSRAMVAAVLAENQGALRWNSTNGFNRWGRISYVRCLGHDFWVKQLTKLGRHHRHLLDRVITEKSPATQLPVEVAS